MCASYVEAASPPFTQWFNNATSTTASTSQPQQGLGPLLTGTITTLEVDIEWTHAAFVGGTKTVLIRLRDCDQSNCGGTNIDTDTPATAYNITYNGIVTTITGTLATPVVLNPSHYYRFFYVITGSTATATDHQVGTNFAFMSPGCAANCGGLTAVRYSVYGTLGSSFISIGTATSSSFFSGQNATSTLQDLADQCSQSSNIFSEGICIAFSFLFLPSTDTLDEFTTIQATAASKFPFSWIYGVQSIVSGLTASTTDNMISLTYGLHDIGIGSTTPMGNILPNFTILSQATILTYVSQSSIDALKAIASAGIYLTLVGFLFHDARRRFHRI